MAYNADGVRAAYFEHVHPLYPFLDRIEFERKAFGPQRDQIIRESSPFSALYHAVLALGCQYRGGATFDPGKGRAWGLYQTALGLLSDVLTPKESLVNVQVRFPGDTLF